MCVTVVGVVQSGRCSLQFESMNLLISLLLLQFISLFVVYGRTCRTWFGFDDILQSCNTFCRFTKSWQDQSVV